MTVVRFGVSLEKDLFDALDTYVEENKFSNRSQALRHLISNSLMESKWRCSNEVAGSLTMLYDHHQKDITKHLTDLQHDYHHLIVSSMHLHIDHDQCIEIIAVKGKASELTALADKLRTVKGVGFARLTMARINMLENTGNRSKKK